MEGSIQHAVMFYENIDVEERTTEGCMKKSGERDQKQVKFNFLITCDKLKEEMKKE